MVDKPLRFSGFTSVPGGKVLRDIRISGRVKILSALECVALRASGWVTSMDEVTVHDDCRCSGFFTGKAGLVVGGKLRTSGRVKLAGNVTVGGTLRTSGIFHCGGHLHVEEGRLRAGRSKIGGNVLACLRVDVRHAEIHGNVVAPEVSLRSRTRVDGTVYYSHDLEVSHTVKLLHPPQRVSYEELLHMFPAPPAAASARQVAPRKPSGARGEGLDSTQGTYCPRCGAQVALQANFCFACGERLASRGT